MSLTITLGTAGRRVVPKSIRDSRGLHEGSRLKLEIQCGRIQVILEPDPVGLDLTGTFPVIHAGRPLKRDTIVDAIKEGREARDAQVVTRTRRK